MPPDRFSPPNAFNINLLDSEALGTPDGLQTALRAIEAVCHQGGPETTTVVEALNDRSHILEYIISGTSPRVLICSYEFPMPIISPLVLEETLGTRAQIPTGYMVKTLRSQSTCDSNMPSDQMLSTF